MIGIYSKRVEKTLKILKLLALHGQLYQKELPEKVGTSYRNLIRQLQLLQKAGFIQIARKEPSSKKGKEKHVWELTFNGLITVFQYPLTENEIDLIAASMKDKWLIFQEWETLTKDPEIKAHLIHNIKMFADTQPRLTFEGLKSLNRSETPEDFQKLAEQLLTEKATKAALYLDVFDMGAVPPWIYKPKSGKELLVKLWKTCASNPNIRRFIEKQFENEKIKHKIFKKHFKIHIRLTHSDPPT